MKIISARVLKKEEELICLESIEQFFVSSCELENAFPKLIDSVWWRFGDAEPYIPKNRDPSPFPHISSKQHFAIGSCWVY